MTKQRRTALGLRHRLTIAYTGCLLVLLVGLGVLFRQTLLIALQRATDRQLADSWLTIQRNLRFENDRPIWFFDREEVAEALDVQSSREFFVLAASDGSILEISDAFRRIGPPNSGTIRAALESGKTSHDTVSSPAGRYRIRSGPYLGENRRLYFIAVGAALAEGDSIVNTFTGGYFTFAPVICIFAGLFGWRVAGSVLHPLNEVSRTAARVTSESLNLRIPLRGANDELDRLIASFNNMVDRLEGSFEQMRRFSVDASHELRTPLTAVRSQLEIALMTGSNTNDLREAIVAAIEDVDRVTQVVKSLLHLSQAEMGQVALQREPLDVASAVRRVLEQFEVLADAQEVTIERSIEGGSIIAGDRTQIERLVSNLISNALKYTRHRGHIKVTVQRRPLHIDLIVADDGVGIPAEHLPHIFERFYRVPDGAQTPERGLGLGLSFVAWIARAHGASIDVRSAVGQGAEFRLRFPAAGIEPESTDKMMASGHAGRLNG